IYSYGSSWPGSQRRECLMKRALYVALIVLVLGTVAGVAYLMTRPSDTAEAGYSPYIHGPSKEAETAIGSFRLPKGLRATVWAAEPMLAHPASFCFDERGRCY